MVPHGIHAQEHETPIEDGLKVIHTEVQRGHYPMLSLYNESDWHIWIAVPEGNSFWLVSRAYGVDQPLLIDDLDSVRENLMDYRNGSMNFVTYNVEEQ